MSNFVEAGNSTEFKDGMMKEVEIGAQKILLAKVGDKYYAAGNRCPHLGGKLTQGKLDGTVVTCPLHGSQFDLVDGRVVRWLKGSGLLSSIGKAIKGPQSLTIYNVRVEAEKILVEI